MNRSVETQIQKELDVASPKKEFNHSNKKTTFIDNRTWEEALEKSKPYFEYAFDSLLQKIEKGNIKRAWKTKESPMDFIHDVYISYFTEPSKYVPKGRRLEYFIFINQVFIDFCNTLFNVADKLYPDWRIKQIHNEYPILEDLIKQMKKKPIDWEVSFKQSDVNKYSSEILSPIS